MRRPDLTVLAIPAFVGAMAAEVLWQRRNPAPPGTSRAGDYELADTIASLSMGVGSLVAPFVSARLLDPVTTGRGRWAKVLMGVAVGASAATTVADVVRRRRQEGALPDAGTLPDADPRAPRTGPDVAAHLRDAPLARRLTGATAVAAVASTALTVATTWSAQTSGTRLFGLSSRDLGTGLVANAVAILGWDAIYYWNHRFNHESRWLWAMHVVHHSSERYNLSTALRQPVAEGLTMSVPYGLLALAGVRPSVIENARALNLIYQFWIHTEAVQSIGRLENLLNTPSHHRVHHGVNRQYLDRNHGSILIVWDRLFGTFEPEDERVVYGLTTNIDTYNPITIATHEWRDIARDVAGAQTWRDRWSFLLRGPGWAYDRRAATLLVAPPTGHTGRMATPYTVTRTTTINAPAQRVHSLVNDFHEWQQWSPWEGLDPQMRRTYSGPDAGVGAAYAWEGNRKAGKGDMTVTADTPDQVDIALHFEKPFKERNRIEFLLTPAGDGATTVEWRMAGELSGIMRLFSIVKSMDSLIGPDFEKGLARLKRVAESA